MGVHLVYFLGTNEGDLAIFKPPSLPFAPVQIIATHSLVLFLDKIFVTVIIATISFN